jgi:hypothetical protein
MQAKVPPLWAGLGLLSDLRCASWLMIKPPLCSWKTHPRENNLQFADDTHQRPLAQLRAFCPNDLSKFFTSPTSSFSHTKYT